VSATTTKLPFSERLRQGVMIADGSVRAELENRGMNAHLPEVYNITNTVVIEDIQRRFMDAGAELLQTNTLRANRFALEAENLADRVYEINRKAVWIARTIALQKAYVAGVVGPTGKHMVPVGSITADEAHQAFVEQMVALADGGADVFLLKSFIDMEELQIAIRAARYVRAELPLIALKTFPEDGSVLSTAFPRSVATTLSNHGVDCIGSNGTVGPQRMVSIIQALGNQSVPLCALPDIGIPTISRGRAVYHADPLYVSQVAKRLVEQGVTIIGADGGATTEIVKAIADAVRGTEIGSKRVEIKIHEKPPETDALKTPGSIIADKITTSYVSTVELDVPRGSDMTALVESAAYLKSKGIDAVNISDGARARLRINPIALSYAIQSQTGMECITHIACRDRNMVALQSDMLAAHALGLRNILAVTGDPAHIGDFPLATSVYDIDSIGLIRAVSRMNAGMDLSGNQLGTTTRFSIACAVNPVADDLDFEIARLEQKVHEGCTIAFSQPLFEPAALERFRARTEKIPVRFMLGVIPLRTVRHAEFLHYEVPGMNVPEHIRERMRVHGSSTESASQEGVEIAVEFMREARHMSDGVYLMPPFKKYDMAVEILDRIR
jgi:homocysteine S-methyltransferase